jgi:hypothetical protein
MPFFFFFFFLVCASSAAGRPGRLFLASFTLPVFIGPCSFHFHGTRITELQSTWSRFLSILLVPGKRQF